ncbi:hypothetical protein QYM36_000598 [Artemia franciscana]|uniref:Uncharacterized protein n=1 Tax=Artemia franciscana TaxID=6661 RepID=A0AA88ISW8_ARTSF|nr:hypothetical protein QYM36_000598 [Artemia franciscana]
MQPTRTVQYTDIVNMLDEIDLLPELSYLQNLDDEEEDWTPMNMQNQGDDTETSSKSDDKEDAVPNMMAASNPKQH